jgi:hypothetical protein
MPPSQAKVVAVAIALAHGAEGEPDDAADRARQLWVAAQQAVPAGIPLDEANPFLLEVHRLVELDDADPGRHATERQTRCYSSAGRIRTGCRPAHIGTLRKLAV